MKIKLLAIRLLVFILVKYIKPILDKYTVKEEIKSLNKQDLELLTKAFPPFLYKQDMTAEQVTLGTVKSVGEQRVLQFILSRIQGRIGKGVTYD